MENFVNNTDEINNMEIIHKEQTLSTMRYDVKVNPGQNYTDRQLLDFVNEDSTFGYHIYRQYDVYVLVVNKD